MDMLSKTGTCVFHLLIPGLTLFPSSESPLKTPPTPPSASGKAALDQPVVQDGADGS